VGPNGAGKTSLLKILTNLLLPTSGFATVLDLDSKLLAGDLLRDIGYVSENQQLPLGFNTRQYLDYLRPFYPTWDRQLEASLLRLLDLPLDRKLKRLSRGQRMKAAFVSTLAYRPKLVILDEPFSGLDPLVREELILALGDIARNPEFPTTFVISSHDLDEIESLATHLVYLDKGHVIFSEELALLRNRFRNVRLTTSTVPTEGYPPHWLQPSFNASLSELTFSYSAPTLAASGPDAIRAEVMQLLPEATQIETVPVSLRNLFLAVARDRREQATAEESEARTS
jgi:ABC-2 type transport system ATP-binding protein